MRVDVPGRRAPAELAAEGMQYKIPMRNGIALLCFLPLWLTAWAFGEVFGVRQLLDGDGLQLFNVVWITFWTYAGGSAIYTWLTQAIGKERVTLTPSALTIQRDVIGFEPMREYELSNIRNLRVSPVSPWDAFDWRGKRSRQPRGPIAFDYGAKTYRFGAGIDEAEARAIVEELKGRHMFD